jgi:hypothetical protein
MNDLLNDIDSWWYIPVSLFVIIMDVMAISFMVSVVLAWKDKKGAAAEKGQSLVCPSHLAFCFYYDFYYMFDCLGGAFRFLY